MRRRHRSHRFPRSCRQAGRNNLLGHAPRRFPVEVTTVPQTTSIFPKVFLVGLFILNAAFAAFVFGSAG